MSIRTVMGIEWRRIWRNKLTRAGLAAGLVLPLLYSSLYLWANWDPYGKLNKLPVAIVNQDNGGVLDGKHMNFGRDLTNKLMKDHTLGWQVLSNQDAMSGLQGDRYYMVLRVPPTFTKDILSVNTIHPHAAALNFIPNQGKNYLAGQIVKRVQGDIAANLNASFSQQFISQLLSVVGKEKNGLSTVSVKAGQLAQGAQAAHTGARSLHQGVVTLNAGAQKLVVGLTDMTSGASQLTSGIAKTQTGTQSIAKGVRQADEGIAQIRSQIRPIAGPTSQLANGMGQAAEGAHQLQQASESLVNGTAQAANGASSLAAGTSSAANGGKQIQSGTAQALSLLTDYVQSAGTNADPRVAEAYQVLKQLSPATDSLVAGLGRTEQGASSLDSSLSQIQSGQKKVSDGLGTLSTQLATAANSVGQLAANSGKLDNGLAQIQTGLGRATVGFASLNAAQSQLVQGATALNTGMVQARNGSQSLATGLTTAASGSAHLDQGTSQLANGASTFANRLKETTRFGQVANPHVLSTVMAQPVVAHTGVVNPVAKYGPGLAPYFIPLSLWVGALMLFFLMGMREGRWRVMPVTNTAVLFGKFAVLWAISALQSIVASTVLLVALRLHVGSILGFYGYNIVLSMTYVTVIGMFIALLGSGPGRFISIALLLLQLTSSAGTFPIELVPRFFQIAHPLLPMSYAVTGLRSIISMNDFTPAWHTAVVALSYLVGAFLLLVLATRRRVRPEDLRPADQLIS